MEESKKQPLDQKRFIEKIEGKFSKPKNTIQVIVYRNDDDILYLYDEHIEEILLKSLAHLGGDIRVEINTPPKTYDELKSK